VLSLSLAEDGRRTLAGDAAARHCCASMTATGRNQGAASWFYERRNRLLIALSCSERSAEAFTIAVPAPGLAPSVGARLCAGRLISFAMAGGIVAVLLFHPNNGLFQAIGQTASTSLSRLITLIDGVISIAACDSASRPPILAAPRRQPSGLSADHPLRHPRAQVLSATESWTCASATTCTGGAFMPWRQNRHRQRRRGPGNYKSISIRASESACSTASLPISSSGWRPCCAASWKSTEGSRLRQNHRQHHVRRTHGRRGTPSASRWSSSFPG